MSLLSQAKPCPWCHGQGDCETYGLWMWTKGVPGKFAVACSNPACSATGPLCDTESEAVLRWNAAPRRAASEPAIKRLLDEAHGDPDRDLQPRSDHD